MTKRYALTVAGDFYVEAGCCTLCGVPRRVAPELFGTDAVQCFVKRQPVTDDEHIRMYDAMHQQEFTCIRYAGKDATVLAVLRRKCADLIDD